MWSGTRRRARGSVVNNERDASDTQFSGAVGRACAGTCKTRLDPVEDGPENGKALVGCVEIYFDRYIRAFGVFETELWS